MSPDTMSFLEGELGFTTQAVLWGYVIQGDILEASAVIAEGKNVEAIVPGSWDRDLAWLDRQRVAYGDEDYHRPPERWCLPAVTDLWAIRQAHSAQEARSDG